MTSSWFFLSTRKKVCLLRLGATLPTTAGWLLTCRQWQNSAPNASSNTKWDKVPIMTISDYSTSVYRGVWMIKCSSGRWSLLLPMNWFMPWLRRLVVRLSPRDLGFNLKPFGVGFVLDKLLWKHVFPVRIVPPLLYAYPSVSDATDRADKQHSARTITGSRLCSTVRMFV